MTRGRDQSGEECRGKDGGGKEGRGQGIFQGVAEAVCQILVDWAPLRKSRTLPGPVKGRIFFYR